jgi:VanZ family protein
MTSTRSWPLSALRVALPFVAIGGMLVLIVVAPPKQDTIVFHEDGLDGLLRKIGHILGYGTLAVLVALAIGAVRVRGGAGILRAATARWVLLAAWAAAAAVALGDEYRQSLVPDRTSSMLDVALDIAAAAAGLALLVLWTRRKAAREAGEPPST